jgi:hypothetical protein
LQQSQVPFTQQSVDEHSHSQVFSFFISLVPYFVGYAHLVLCSGLSIASARALNFWETLLRFSEYSRSLPRFSIFTMPEWVRFLRCLDVTEASTLQQSHKHMAFSGSEQLQS